MRPMTSTFRFLVLLVGMLFYPLHAKEVSIDLDGLKLNGNLIIADGKNFEDGVALIVHGMMAHNKMELIETMQQSLQEQGYSSLAFNLSLGISDRRGFFNCDNHHRHVQDNAVDEIAVWVNWLKQKGTEQIVLISHSRGANQSMVYAAQQLDTEVKQLVMLAPGVDDLPFQYENRFESSFEKNLFRMVELAASGKGDIPVAGIDFWYCPKASVTPNSFLSYYGEQSPFRQFTAQLANVTIPTLVITGTLDEVEPRVANKVHPFTGKGIIQLMIIDGSDHFFRDFNIDEAMEAVMVFINQN